MQCFIWGLLAILATVKAFRVWAVMWRHAEGLYLGIVGLVLRSVSGWEAVFYLALLDPTRPLIKPKTPSNVVGWYMEPRGVSAVCGCWAGIID